MTFEDKSSAPASVVAALARQARERPLRTALVAGGRSVTYAEVHARAAAVAGMLERRGIKPGDRVLAVASSASVAFAFAYFGIHLAGAVCVPLDPAAPPARVRRIRELSGARLIVGTDLDPDCELGAMTSDELDEASGSERPPFDPEATTLADVLFTTGTGGSPKGVMLCHEHTLAAARHINAVIGNGPDDVEVVPLPLSHSFGLGRLRCNVLTGGTLVLTQGFRMPGEIFSALKRERATGLAGVPAGFTVLLRFGARGLGAFADQLRYVEIGSAAMRLEDKRELMRLLPRTKLFMHYGLTEASRSAFIEFHRDSLRLETVGRPAPGVEMELRNEDGSRASPGERGVLWVRGAHVARGYFNDPSRTASTFVDGWVSTGDVAQRTSDGYLILHGRGDDMMNVGGFSVWPEEVERALEEHPSVAEAACIGVPDPRGIAGQVLRAYLVPAAGAASPSFDEIRAFTSVRLEPYKVPLDYQWLDVLPRTASGKLQRAVLRAQAGAAVQHHE